MSQQSNTQNVEILSDEEEKDVKSQFDSKNEAAKPPYTITVSEPEVKGSTFNKTYLYKIETAPAQPAASVQRRYKEFDWLRDALVKTFPGLFVPPLPPKSLLDNLRGEYASKVRPELERFLYRVSVIPVLVNSEPFKLFIGNADHFDEEMKKYDKKVDSRPIDEVLAQFKDLFADQMSYNLTEKAETEIVHWNTFLTQSEEKLSLALELSSNLSITSQNQVNLLTKLHPLTTQVIETENAFPNLPGNGRLDISEPVKQWSAAAKEIENAHSTHLVNAFKYEVQDIQAFLELLKLRQEVFNQTQKAISNAKKWKNPDTQITTDKLKKQKETDEKKEEHGKAYLEAVTKLILAQQASVFWREKTYNFKRSISSFAKSQLQATKQLNALFEKLYQRASAEQ